MCLLKLQPFPCRASVSKENLFKYIYSKCLYSYLFDTLLANKSTHLEGKWVRKGGVTVRRRGKYEIYQEFYLIWRFSRERVKKEKVMGIKKVATSVSVVKSKILYFIFTYEAYYQNLKPLTKT